LRGVRDDFPIARMDEEITEKPSLDETAKKLTEDIQNMSNYKALYNEIQVSLSRCHEHLSSEQVILIYSIFLIETRRVVRRR